MFFAALLAQAVGELQIKVHAEIFFEALPVVFVVSDLLAPGAVWQQASQLQDLADILSG